MTRIPLPSSRIPVVGTNGLVTTPWYAFFAQFLQGLSDDVSGGAADLTALTARVTLAEGDVDLLQAADVVLAGTDSVLAATDVALAATDLQLAAADRDLWVDEAMRPDPTSALASLAARLTALELTLDMMADRGAEIDALRQRIAALETDISLRGF